METKLQFSHTIQIWNTYMALQGHYYNSMIESPCGVLFFFSRRKFFQRPASATTKAVAKPSPDALSTRQTPHRPFSKVLNEDGSTRMRKRWEKNGWRIRDQGYYGNSGHRRPPRFSPKQRITSELVPEEFYNRAELHLSQCVHTIIITSPKHVVRGLRDIEKKREKPTATMDGQGVAIYRQVTTTQLHLHSPATTANKLDKTIHRCQTNSFLGGTRTRNDS